MLWRFAWWEYYDPWCLLSWPGGLFSRLPTWMREWWLRELVEELRIEKKWLRELVEERMILWMVVEVRVLVEIVVTAVSDML